MNKTYVFSEGYPYPLGATCDKGGVNFALFSSKAKKVELCLFDDNGEKEIDRYQLAVTENQIWHIYLHHCQAGQIYGYRIEGCYQPSQGLRFNSHKLLIDPYAKKLHGEFQWSDKHYPYIRGHSEEDLIVNIQNNAKYIFKSQVVDLPTYKNKHPKIAWSDTIIYECHVKGATQLHPDIPDSIKGTFSGLCHDSIIQHLKKLGITTIELLPVQQFVSEATLEEKGLSNYWGYNTLNFFTPHKAYLSGDDIKEFQVMVATFHQAGIEVILDVVYNHTAEGDRRGSSLSWRGIDNASYYRLHQQDPRYYINDTGCGNTLDLNHPRCLQMVMDSLRYWVEIMGVDGFRFDLAPILGREPEGFSATSGFFQAIIQDPILSQVKLIAEPWDIGPGGYQLGAFPIPWSEWNDRYRDIVRRFWRGDLGVLPEFARRIHGSSDIFEHNGRSPYSSINFITSHDGFTLYDLVSFNEKNNLANGEDNNDGHSENFSFNYGDEGLTNNEVINATRLKQKKNLLLTLLLSQGVPMLRGGDEFGHSQQGNNNAYCQDNEINWLDWHKKTNSNTDMCEFISRLINLRKKHAGLRHRNFIHKDNTPYEITWFNRQGNVMKKEDWSTHSNLFLAYMLTHREQQRHILCIFNAHTESINFPLEHLSPKKNWILLLNTLPNQQYNKHLISEHQLTISAQSAWILSSNISE
jgi:glycogen operon protein